MELTHSFRYRYTFWSVFFFFFLTLETLITLVPFCALRNELKETVSKQPLTKC